MKEKRRAQVSFMAPFGSERKLVSISSPEGAGGTVYDVLVCGYFQGRVAHVNGRWVCWPSTRGELYQDDVDAIVELIEGAENGV